VDGGGGHEWSGDETEQEKESGRGEGAGFHARWVGGGKGILKTENREIEKLKSQRPALINFKMSDYMMTDFTISPPQGSAIIRMRRYSIWPLSPSIPSGPVAGSFIASSITSPLHVARATPSFTVISRSFHCIGR